MSEYHDQAALFEWAALQACAYPELGLMFATLNGAKLAGGGARAMPGEVEAASCMAHAPTTASGTRIQRKRDMGRAW